MVIHVTCPLRETEDILKMIWFLRHAYRRMARYVFIE